MRNKFNTPWSPVGDKTRFGYMLNCNGNRLDLEHSRLLNRVAQCVNACAGMDDPVAEVQRLKNKVAASMLDNKPISAKAGNSDNPYFMTIEATLGSVRGDIESAKSIYASSPETLQKAVDEARSGGFKTKSDFSDFPAVPSWQELGILPPVGTMCEMQDDKDEWVTAEIIAHKSRYAFGWCADREMVYFSAMPHEFLPLQTEKQKTIAAMLECFDGFFEGKPRDNAGDVCEKIYDKFMAKKA